MDKLPVFRVLYIIKIVLFAGVGALKLPKRINAVWAHLN